MNIFKIALYIAWLSFLVFVCLFIYGLCTVNNPSTWIVPCVLVDASIFIISWLIGLFGIDKGE